MKKTAVLKFSGKVLHIPEWLPGSWIGREAKKASRWMDEIVESLYRYAQEHMLCFRCTKKKRS